ncbi:uncharacterized protein Z519_07968 [Cladophialophora bantiana CBS 173.52]|uniref:Uncharacterized protein n=1 Tax=Cladophialophora bantiana (strain ATCC 10958 / CBS 173.52 / CDC B-1940 / NIH 8579) TaxID=1442370 RepID=A0A0D2I2J2_CLAB1|nr:uncharacterized protein Z519_07968 [Cladophialophora bantiana CBS 173.52]KIW91074.1 hypothetical protein Z519_07968 [Cladophialophora bantiana CBS 173.52]
MHFTTITVGTLALALGISAAEHGFRARQSASLVRVNVGDIVLTSGQTQTLGVSIVEGATSGSEAFGFSTSSAVLRNSDIQASGLFTSALCLFTSARIGNDADGKVACDLGTVVGSGTSSDEGSTVTFDADAVCMFCQFE